MQGAFGAIPKGARERTTLGAAGLVGVAAAAPVPVDAIAAWLGTMRPGPAMRLVASPARIVTAGQVALGPITMAVFAAYGAPAIVILALPKLW